MLRGWPKAHFIAYAVFPDTAGQSLIRDSGPIGPKLGATVYAVFSDTAGLSLFVSRRRYLTPILDAASNWCYGTNHELSARRQNFQMNDDSDQPADRGPLTLNDEQWREARRRAEVIGPLADCPAVSQQAAEDAGRALGLSGRTVYTLVRAWRRSGGSIPVLVPPKPTGGRGKHRISVAADNIIADAVDWFYLKPQKPSVAAVVREVRRRCRLVGIVPPALNTVKDRINKVRPEKSVIKREGSKPAQRLRPAPGATPNARAPLDAIQIDHTKIDVIVVDSAARLPIGRPYLTVAIDEFSRCIVGICITLEAPSATSVGLCITHIATNKKPWLERLDVECEWPMHGKPRRIYVDNGAEFHSEGLRRGCEAHGIKLDHRPMGRPHYGGIVERVIGTAMRMLHELPGTTFSNIQQRGTYNSDAKAALTLAELERWITLAICGRYHNEWHSTIKQTPAAKWGLGIEHCGEPTAVQNASAFLIDFLPIVKRRIQRCGFVVDHIGYYASALSPWIAARDRCAKYSIRTDPRDLSRIWVLDPERSIYIEVPFRALSNPPITKWEQRAALTQLREQGRKQIDEATIFKAIAQMRTIVATATKETRAMRRNRSRRAHLATTPDNAPVLPLMDVSPLVEIPTADDGSLAQPFDDVEEW
jgi:putative transposase